MSSAVTVAGLHESYGSVAAVRGVGFTVAAGEIFALLGPNGAGKTTTWRSWKVSATGTGLRGHLGRGHPGRSAHVASGALRASRG